MKTIPKILWFCCITWLYTIYYLVNKWEYITDDKYLLYLFILTVFIMIEIIWFLIWSIKNHKFKTRLGITLLIVIIINILICYTNASDWISIYPNFYAHQNDRNEVVELTLKSAHDFPLEGKFKYLSVQGSQAKYEVYGCPIVSFQVYDGTHSILDYGNDGYMVYVSDENSFNKEGFCNKYKYTKRKIIGKIKDHWLFVITGVSTK